MLRLILLRHGEVDNPKKVFYGRSLDIPLNNIGRDQIKSIANKIVLLPFQVTTIYSSPLLRAMQTAEIVSKKLGLTIIPIEDLMDVHIPALVGKPISIRKELHAKGEDEYEGLWVEKGNEKRNNIKERVMKVFKHIKDKNRAGIPLIVSHGDPLICLLFSLENPDKALPRIGELKKNGYGIKKGCAVILQFNDQGNIEKKEELNSKDNQ